MATRFTCWSTASSTCGARTRSVARPTWATAGRSSALRGRPLPAGDVTLTRETAALILVLHGRLVQLAAVGAGLGPRFSAGECQPQDRALDHPELLEERPGVVRQLVALADLTHLGCDLRVARRRHVGEEVMLDLVTQVAARQVEDRPARDVAGAEQLPDVARTGRLVLRLLLREDVGLIGEVAAEDDRVGPDVADHVRRRVRHQGGLVIAPERVAEAGL